VLAANLGIINSFPTNDILRRAPYLDILATALGFEIMSAPRVLLLGGHGKVALHLTPLLLAKSWNVTTIIRDPKHQDEILALGKDQKGQVDVLVESLEDVKSDADAQKVLDKVKPDYVVWSAG
jgi:nucleoside-diphosphate-sugar epimerase